MAVSSPVRVISHAEAGVGAERALDDLQRGVVAAHGVDDDVHRESTSSFTVSRMASERWRQLGVLVALALDPVIQRRDDAEVHVHGLEVSHRLVADIQSQRADGRLLRKVDGRLSLQAARQLHARQKTAGAGLHIALHAGHLTGKGDTGIALEPVVAVKQPGRIQIGVAVHDAVAQILRVVQGGDHGEHALLLAPISGGSGSPPDCRWCRRRCPAAAEPRRKAPDRSWGRAGRGASGGRSGRVSSPRRAMTSTGMQPSNTLASSKPWTSASSAVASSCQKVRYSSLVRGQLM